MIELSRASCFALLWTWIWLNLQIATRRIKERFLLFWPARRMAHSRLINSMANRHCWTPATAGRFLFSLFLSVFAYTSSRGLLLLCFIIQVFIILVLVFLVYHWPALLFFGKNSALFQEGYSSSVAVLVFTALQNPEMLAVERQLCRSPIPRVHLWVMLEL